MTNTETPIATTPEALKAAGFVAVRYPGQDGIFHRRDTSVRSMPYLGQQEDDELIFGSCIACTEVTPDMMVHIFITETDYKEEAVPADSDEGQGLLRDAIEGEADNTDLDEVLRA